MITQTGCVVLNTKDTLKQTGKQYLKTSNVWKKETIKAYKISFL